MAVDDHLHTSTQAASRYAQYNKQTQDDLLRISFTDVWKATDGFDKECASMPT